MLTFLIVEKSESGRIFPLKSKIITEEKESQGINVKYIKYICKGKKLRWDKIKKLCGADADRLLCREDVSIPENSGIRRFSCDELKIRLSLNMAIEVLKKCDSLEKSIKTAVYDPEGLLADSAGVLLNFTDSLTAVTRMTGMYRAEAERIMEESGAVLNVSKNMRSLAQAQLVVAPSKLRAVLPLSKWAVVLTVDEPACLQRCVVLDRYSCDLDEELACLVPEGFCNEYFASALYTLCSRYDLGSAVPTAAKGGSAEYTMSSLSQYLMNIAANT